MTRDNDAKRLERRARFLMLNKEIPAAKMEVVRSLLANDKLLAEEKYGAVIEMLKNCDDKKQTEARPVETAPAKERVIRTPRTLPPAFAGPASSSVFVDELLTRYAPTRLFRKRLLIHTSSWFRLGIKKRIVPTKHLYRLMQQIRTAQEKLLTRIVPVMDSIIADPDAQDPVAYNQLRVIYSWLLLAPLANLDFNRGKWLDCPTFEIEFKAFFIGYFSLSQLPIDAKERLILTFEDRLRQLPDLIKSQSVGSENEDLRREKEIHAVMMILRSFVPTVSAAGGSIDRLIQDRHSLAGMAPMLIAIMESLVFRRGATENELLSYYSVKPLTVKTDTWDCSGEILRRFGKDEESRKRRQIERLRTELVPMDRMVEFIGMKFEGSDILRIIFDEQWKVVNKRRQDGDAVKLEDFFTYIDECVSYFEKGILPFLDGTELVFTHARERVDGALFTRNSFESRSSTLAELMKDINSYRTNMPNERITRDEARRIMMGSIKTMDHMQSFLARIGALFYSIGHDLLNVLFAHEAWMNDGAKDDSLIRVPVNLRDANHLRPLPFYDCVFAGADRPPAALRLMTGRAVYAPSVRDGLFNMIIAFCFQMAYEVMADDLLKELDYRKDLRNEVKLLGGKP